MSQTANTLKRWCFADRRTVVAAVDAPIELILDCDAKCTSCHGAADDAVPTMLELHWSVLLIGKTRHEVIEPGTYNSIRGLIVAR